MSLKILDTFVASNRNYYCKVKCTCGNIFITRRASLKSGITKSCGCLHKKITAKLKYRHGGASTKEYKRWTGLKQRCTNSRDKGFSNYGGRGISVCDRWKDFKNFIEDMGPAPKDYLLDRIDNSKGYCKENCRWVSPKDSVLNRRATRWLTYNGETRCARDWARKLNVPVTRIYWRLNAGWPLKDVIEAPCKS